MDFVAGSHFPGKDDSHGPAPSTGSDTHRQLPREVEEPCAADSACWIALPREVAAPLSPLRSPAVPDRTLPGEVEYRARRTSPPIPTSRGRMTVTDLCLRRGRSDTHRQLPREVGADVRRLRRLFVSNGRRPVRPIAYRVESHFPGK